MQSPGPLGTSGADSLQPCQQGASKRNRKFRRVQKPHEEPTRLSARMCEDTSFGEDLERTRLYRGRANTPILSRFSFSAVVKRTRTLVLCLSV